jgi:myosin heavy subunit
VLAAILQLGNLCFEPGRQGGAELLTPEPLATAARLLRVPLASLTAAVLYRPPRSR